MIIKKINNRLQKYQLNTKLFLSKRQYNATTLPFDIDNYKQQILTNYSSIGNQFGYYQYIVAELNNFKNLSVISPCDLLNENPSGKRLITLRHDIDADPFTALRCARELVQYRICAGFYVLHTAAYYGHMYQGLFIRNPYLVQWVQNMIVAGAEIGLHTDGLGALEMWNANPLKAVTDEIIWLRSCGANIKGTVAHNSLTSYSAENFEIFEEYCLTTRSTTKRTVSEYLGQLSAKQLGLLYEGTFSTAKAKTNTHKIKRFMKDKAGFSSKDWTEMYLKNSPYRDYSIDFQFWLVGKDEWVISGHYDELDIFDYKVPLNKVLSTISNLPQGSRSMMVIHPEYVCL